VKPGLVYMHLNVGRCMFIGFARVNGVAVMSLLTMDTATSMRVYVDAERAGRVLREVK
jgi:hypothetical protein